MDDANLQGSQESPFSATQFPVAQVQPVRTPSQAIGLVVSRLWIATLLCLIVALALVWLQVRAGRPAIDVLFAQGHGLQPGDPVRFRGINVGQVSEIELSVSSNGSLDGVIVRIHLNTSAAELAREGSRFWIERPDISVGQIRGLDTLIGGRFVGVVPGPPDAKPCKLFYGLDVASAPVENIANGLEIVLEGKKRFGLQNGSPISYRGVIVGQIFSVGLTNDAATVEARAFIQPNYRELVRENTRFWSTSGLDVKIGLGGIELDAETLATIAAGGVAFATPNQPGRRATTGHRFELIDSPRESWINWQPRIAIGSATLPAGAATPRPLLGNRRGRGPLAVLGAGRQRGWLLPLSDGRLLGPANVLSGEDDKEYLLEVSGREFSLPLKGLRLASALAVCKLPTELDAEVENWPMAKVRTSEGPEEVIVTCGSDDMTMPISTERMSMSAVPDEPGWSIDPSVPLDDQWHGASVVAARDGQVIGILIRSGDRSRIVLLPVELMKQD